MVVTFFVIFCFGSCLSSVPIPIFDPTGAPRLVSFGFRAWRLRFPLTTTPLPRVCPDDDSEESERRQELTRTSTEGDWAVVTRKEQVWLDTIDPYIVQWTPKCYSGTQEHLCICGALRIAKGARMVV